jgi:tetratricopeptide (TPR) repeat protein
MSSGDTALPPFRDRVFLIVALLATVLVYVPTLAFPFAADDASQILGNPRVHSWRYIPEYFKTHVWGHLALGNGERGAAYYRPLFLLWELGTWTIFGSNPMGWHASAIALHVLATALVYFLARRIAQNSLAAFVAALLFGIHPIHVEGVTWISGATEPLGAVTFLGSMLCWLRAYDLPRPLPWRVAALALYALALLAKETTIVLPAVMMAYQLIVRRERAGLVRRMLPYAAVAMFYLLVRQVVLSGTAHTPIPFTVLLLTWPSVLWFYLRHVLFPVRLSLIYDLPLVTQFSWSGVGLPAAGVALIGACAIWWVRVNRMARFAAVWFAAVWALLAILPPLYLRAFSPVEIAHDRYLYLPSIGVCLLLALGLQRMSFRAAAVGTGALAVFFAGLTLIESRPWSDEVSLFYHATQVAPQSWHAKRQLAFALERSHRYDDAMPLLAAILDATPDDHVAAFAMGACAFHTGNFMEAERMMRRAIALRPSYQQPYLLLAAILIGQHRVDEAEEQWQQSRAVQLGDRPEPAFHLVRADILMARGDFLGAVAEYRNELEVQPGNQEIATSLLRAEDAAARQR